MKDKILKLRQEGKSYKQIQKELGCSLSTIAHHCGKGQKQKGADRKRKRRENLVILNKVENFQYDRRIKDKAEDFQRPRLLNEHGKPRLGKRELGFTWKDVINKFGWETSCYLTGRTLNLREPRSYQFDHVVPLAKGGTSQIENLGICCRDANQAKHDMTVDQLIGLCKEVLEHNGYVVTRG